MTRLRSVPEPGAPFSPGHGDVSALICPFCGESVHETTWVFDGDDLVGYTVDADITRKMAEHFQTAHPHRYRLVRWLTRGWWTG